MAAIMENARNFPKLLRLVRLKGSANALGQREGRRIGKYAFKGSGAMRSED